MYSTLCRRVARPVASATTRRWLAQVQSPLGPSATSGHDTTPEQPPHFLSLLDHSPQTVINLLSTARHFKLHTQSVFDSSPLRGKTLALLFSKRSTRTRVAAETSMTLLGGRALFLSGNDIQLGVNESLRDTARVLSGMVDGIMARVDSHEELEELCTYSEIPVINALSDLYHPTQILADLLTIYEANVDEASYSLKSGRPITSTLSHLSFEGLRVAWIGDGNNVCHSWMNAAALLNMDLTIATPPSYKPAVRAQAAIEAKVPGARITLCDTPEQAIRDAQIVITDTWTSMGQEAEKAQRLADFSGYQITEELLRRSGAHPACKFLHCLPRKAEEVDDEVFYGPRSLVFEEAHNRKWTIMSVLYQLMHKKSWD
ncbi:ornithine carbamoyltransferase [Sorochytrium milnesiophthora]